ncbi:MAG: hypothetical protein HY686_05815 [Chloroflexi bacterium]|nr:hypothetical protein [Chloroflexota bacterium]
MSVLLWLLAVEALGVVAFPLAFYLFPALRDRGYAFAKPLGLLLLAYPIWLLGSLHILPSARWSILLVLALIALASALLTIRHRREFMGFVWRERALLLGIEGVFLLLFLGWTLYRAYDPFINHTEKPMDFAFLNASLQATYFPPDDPWLQGFKVSYYYFGYLMMALLTKLTGIPSNISYNLALSLVPAMAAAGALSLVFTIVRGLGGSWGKGFLYGVVAVLLLLVVSNLEGSLELLRVLGLGSMHFWQGLGIKGLEGPLVGTAWYPTDGWWWWRATRVVDTVVGGRSLDYTIQEFPFFSLLLGDLHPHVMSLPFVLFSLAFPLNLLASGERLDTGWLRRRWPWVIVGGLALGALGFMNSWDLPTFLIFTAAVVVVKALRDYRLERDRRVLLGLAGLLGALLFLAVVLYTPFYLGLATQARGILPAKGPVTRPLHFLLVWGLPLLALAPFLVTQVQQATARLSARYAMLALGLPLGLFTVWALAAAATGQSTQVSPRLLHLLPGLLVLALCLYRAMQLTEPKSNPESVQPAVQEGAPEEPQPTAGLAREVGLLFALGLVALGLVLLIVPEMFYVVDTFANTPSWRMNTVFKLYYQAWAVLALAAAVALYYWDVQAARLPPVWHLARVGWWAVLLLVFVGTLYYPTAGIVSKAGGFKGPATLDGLGHLKRDATGEYMAIQWLRDNAKAGEGIVEAIGNDYSAFGMVSAASGRPTVLGWIGHELQWRGSSAPMDGRAEAVAAIYREVDDQKTRALLEQYGVRYVVVGQREQSTYGDIRIAKHAGLVEPVFSRDGVTIYRVKE